MMPADFSVWRGLLNIQSLHFQEIQDFQKRYYESHDISDSSKPFQPDLTQVSKVEEKAALIVFYVFPQIQQPYCFYASLHCQGLILSFSGF